MKEEQYMLDKLEKYGTKINEVVELDFPERHSFFQLQYFILNKEPTTQAKLWQCIREIKSRQKSLESLQLEIEDQQDNLELALLDIEEFAPDADELAPDKRRVITRRKLYRKKNQISGVIADLKKRQKALKEEIVFFVVAYEKLSELESLKSFDSEEVQKEYWENKMRTELNARALTSHPLDPELLKTIMALHDDSEIKNQVKLALLQRQQVAALKDGQ